jgi:hypothetical protein
VISQLQIQSFDPSLIAVAESGWDSFLHGGAVLLALAAIWNLRRAWQRRQERRLNEPEWQRWVREAEQAES